MDTEKRNSVNSRATTIPALPATYVRLGALIALGLAAFVVGWLVMNRGGDEAPAVSGATATSESELRSFAESASHPGLLGRAQGRLHVRAHAHDRRPRLRALSPRRHGCRRPARTLPDVGTYPRKGAFAELKRAARADGAVSLKLERGGLAVFSDTRPTSVYFGYPDARTRSRCSTPPPARRAGWRSRARSSPSAEPRRLTAP